jgi:hypothetical protein
VELLIRTFWHDNLQRLPFLAGLPAYSFDVVLYGPPFDMLKLIEINPPVSFLASSCFRSYLLFTACSHRLPARLCFALIRTLSTGESSSTVPSAFVCARRTNLPLPVVLDLPLLLCSP